MEIAQNEPIPTADIIAKQNNVSRETVKRAEKFADGVDKIATVNPKLKESIKAMAKENQKCGQGGVLLPQISAEATETRKEVAKIAGVSHDTTPYNRFNGM